MRRIAIREWPDPNHYQALEDGKILEFPSAVIAPSADDAAFLRQIGLTSGTLHKNIAYRPAEDKVTGFAKESARDSRRLLEVMRSFSQRVVRFVNDCLPAYARSCRLDYASFRPVEEEGRELPLKKRNDLLHVDAFPTRPTHGDLILRVFTNIHPERARAWLVSDPFESIAPRYAHTGDLRAAAAHGSLFSRAGRRIAEVFGPKRSPYDRFMLRFHDYLKANTEFQQDCPKYRIDFEPGAAWMVFTDIVPHAVLSGRFALEQTFIVPRTALVQPEKAPAAIFERLCQERMVRMASA